MQREFIREEDKSECKKCPLYYEKHGRTHFLPTEVKRREDGSVDILYVGEAPGDEEDSRGIPFVGKSGQLLRKLVRSTHSNEDGIAYTNAIRCQYGPSKWSESSALKAVKVCKTYLKRDIERLKPRVIVPMGANAITALFKEDTRLAEVRGKVNVLNIGGEDTIVIATNHTAAALRKPGLVSVCRTDMWRASMIAEHGYDDDLPTARKGKFVLINDLETLRALVDHVINNLTEEDVVALDIEAANLNKKYGNALATVQIAWTHKTGYVIPYAHPETPWDAEELLEVKTELIRLFTAKAKFRYWLAHNKKMEDMVLRQALGVHPTNAPFIDSMHMLFLIDENRLELREKKGKGLDPFSLEYASIEFLEYYHYSRREKDDLRKNIMGSPLLEVAEYGAKDVYVLRRLFDVLLEFCEIDYIDKMMNLTENLYAIAAHGFSVMETNGFFADLSLIRKLIDPRNPKGISARLKQITEEIKKLPAFIEANNRVLGDKLKGVKSIFKKPWVFDLGKPAHQEVLFFDVLNLEPVDFTDSGKPSVGRKFRAEYWDGKNNLGVKEVGIFEEYSELSKMENTYLVSLLERIKPASTHEDAIDCRIRPNFGLTATVTARTQCVDPNLQQTPRADNPVKKAIKSIFRAGPGRVLVQADFMAFEVRWLALIAKDKKLGQMFWKGKQLRDTYRKAPTKELKIRAELEGDIHRNTASNSFGVPLLEVSKVQRTSAKAIVFGSMYGKHIKSLARDLHISLAEAQVIFDKIFGNLPETQKWFDDIEAHGEKYGWVESPFGRRRHINEFLIGDIGRAKRLARNSPIQSAASDTCLVGIGLLQKFIEKNNKDWKLVNAVHDSVLLDIPEDELEQCLEDFEMIFTVKLSKYLMKKFGIDLSICPLEVEFEIGRCWGNLVKWDFTKGQLKVIKKWLRSNVPELSKQDKEWTEKIENWIN